MRPARASAVRSADDIGTIGDHNTVALDTMTPMTTPRVILIGGTSNTGKSTVARLVAAETGSDVQSTDSLARHPGRPWRTPEYELPPHVVEHYSTLSRAALLTDVLAHYERLWPRIDALIADRVSDSRQPALVLEGSALWPSRVITVLSDQVVAVWLSADHHVLQQRMHDASGYDGLPPTDKNLVDQFLGRSADYQEEMLRLVGELELTSIDASKMDAAAAAAAAVAAAVSMRRPA